MSQGTRTLNNSIISNSENKDNNILEHQVGAINKNKDNFVIENRGKLRILSMVATWDQILNSNPNHIVEYLLTI